MKTNQTVQDELTAILKLSNSLSQKQIEWRRHFHRNPELSFEEHATTARLKSITKSLGLKIIPLKMKTGLLAEVVGSQPGPTVAIRTDIDALPVKEQTRIAYRSEIPGLMHACGHDVHMATVLGAAAVLARMKKHMAGNVRFLFQPAEEKPPGGARPMIAEGALKNVSMIFGLHVDPTLPVGQISLRDGVSMASVTDLDIIIHGRGGHAARPHDTVDAVVVAAEVISSVQRIISRELNPIAPAVLTFGMIEGGRARNTIADEVTLTGTIRTFSSKMTDRIQYLVKRTASAICRAHGARAEVRIVAGYPVLDNHPGANEILSRNFKSLFPRNKIKTTELVLGGEDFACYLQKVPGAMFRLGIRNRTIKADKPWHSPLFKVDERSMPFGTALLAASALDSLKGMSK